MGQNYDICPNWTTFASKFPAPLRLTRALRHSIHTAAQQNRSTVDGKKETRHPSRPKDE